MTLERRSLAPPRPVVGIVLALLLGAPSLWAADPSVRWFTITTPHFFVHYYRSSRHDLQAVAQRAAHIAERVHQVLVPYLRHEPSERTHLVVSDDTDAANGSATILPYNVVRVFVTAPDAFSELNDYDDWMYGLLIHEYSHILHIDHIVGLPRVVNAIFGKIWSPNQIQPRWYIEGLATFEESQRTAGGRVRSNISEMVLRVAALDGKLFDLGQAENSRLFPRSVALRLYGARFL